MQSQEQGQQSQEWDYYNNMPVGEILRRARMHYGLTLQQVEAILCIRAGYLEALENGDLSVLPGKTYAVGFIRTYAEYLRLDGAKIVQLFKAQSIGNGMRPELYYPSAASESKIPNKLILLGSSAGLLALIVFLSAIGILSIQKREMVPPVPEDIKISLNPQMNMSTPLEAAILNAIEPAAGDASKQPIIINIKDSVWLEIRGSNDKALISKVLSKGDSYELPDEEGLVLDTGNAGALEIVIGDLTISKLGEVGDIIRNISLDLESLEQLENLSEESLAEENLTEE
jgi:cytoskeletal protein RodZ